MLCQPQCLTLTRFGSRDRPAVVDHGDAQPAEVELRRLRRTPPRDVRTVIVTENDVHGRKGGQLVKDLRGTAAAVQDHVRVSQVFGHCRRARLPLPRRMRIGQHDRVRKVLDTPEMSEVAELVRGELADAVRSAAIAATASTGQAAERAPHRDAGSHDSAGGELHQARS